MDSQITWPPMWFKSLNNIAIAHCPLDGFVRPQILEFWFLGKLKIANHDFERPTLILSARGQTLPIVHRGYKTYI